MSTITEWTDLERLLLAQAVNKYGEDSWAQVSRTLKQHPLLQDHAQPELFNQKNCSLQYSLMIETMDCESAQTNGPNNSAQSMPKVVKLARQLYFQRVEDLKRIISEDEERFMTLLAEINDIKSGAAAITTDERQPSPAKTDGDIKSAVENGTMEKDDTNIPTDKSITQQDIEMEESEKALTKDDNDADLHQQGVATASTPMDLSPEQNETTTTEHQVNDIQETATEGKEAKELEEESTITTQQPQLDEDTLVAKLDQPDQKDSDLLTETPIANEKSAPSSSPTAAAAAAADETLTSEPTSTELVGSTKRPQSDSTSPSTGLDQHAISESSPKRQRLDHADIPRSPSFSTPAQSADDQSETKSIDEDTTPDLVNINKTPNTTEAPEADEAEQTEQAESDLPVEESKPSPITATPAQSPPPQEQPQPSSTNATVVSAKEPSPIVKTESPGIKTKVMESTPGSTAEAGEGTEEEEDNLSLSLKDADGTESVAGTDSNAATPSATSTTTTEKRRSFSIGNIKDDPRQKSWQKNVNHLWREIANHKNGAMFMNPIKESQAPLYYNVVKYPMDLKTIKNRIRDGVIRTTVEFERDVVLMLTNSLMYNKEGTEIYQMAHEMLQDVTEQIKIFKTADGNSSSHIKGASILTKD